MLFQTCAELSKLRYTKVWSQDSSALCVFLQKSADEYQAIQDFAKKHKVTTMKQELAICDEMIKLLPVKIGQLQAGRRFHPEW